MKTHLKDKFVHSDGPHLGHIPPQLAMIDKLAGLIGTIRLIYNYSHYYYSTAKVSSILVKVGPWVVHQFLKAFIALCQALGENLTLERW